MKLTENLKMEIMQHQIDNYFMEIIIYNLCDIIKPIYIA
jgi:hypothetical protein